jgi:hypothetical protein
VPVTKVRKLVGVIVAAEAMFQAAILHTALDSREILPITSVSHYSSLVARWHCKVIDNMHKQQELRTNVWNPTTI